MPWDNYLEKCHEKKTFNIDDNMKASDPMVKANRLNEIIKVSNMNK